MIDKDFIRKNPEKLDEALANRILEPLSKDILSLDLELRNILTTKNPL